MPRRAGKKQDAAGAPDRQSVRESLRIPEDSARQSSGALKGDNILWQTFYCFLIRFSLVKML